MRRTTLLAAACLLVWPGAALAVETTITQAPRNPGNEADVTVAFSADVAGAGFACALDGAVAAPCISPLAVTDLADGVHTLTVAATGPDGVADTSPAAVRFRVDTRAPAPPRPPRLAAVQRAARFSVRYATYARPWPYTYEVRVRELAPRSTRVRERIWLRASKAAASGFAGRRGGGYCFSSRATDPAGNASAYGAETCTAVPLDDSVFGGSRPWVLRRDAAAFAGTITALPRSVNGAFLITPPLHAGRARLLAIGCPACGALLAIVYAPDGRSRSATISLHRARRGPLEVALPFTFDPADAVRLQLLATATSGPIAIDGLALLPG